MPDSYDPYEGVNTWEAIVEVRNRIVTQLESEGCWDEDDLMELFSLIEENQRREVNKED